MDKFLLKLFIGFDKLAQVSTMPKCKLRLMTDFFVESPEAAFIDLGANIGVYSAFASQLGFKKIVAIEADPEVFARLNFNLSDDVTKLNIAIAEEDGVLPFYINEQNRGQNSLVNKTGREVHVPTLPLLTVVHEQIAGVKYALKLDVEGMEQKILAKLFADAAPEQQPSLIIIEHLHAPEVIELIEKNCYKAVLRTKMNAVYTKV